LFIAITNIRLPTNSFMWDSLWSCSPTHMNERLNTAQAAVQPFQSLYSSQKPFKIFCKKWVSSTENSLNAKKVGVKA
jgi:hypothetical protein